jgi:hypothetical protein
MRYSPAGATAYEVPVPNAPVRRERSERMDALLRKVNGSTRYSVASLKEQTTKALAQRKA